MIIVYSGTRNLYECMMPSIHSLLEHNNPKKIYILIEDDQFPYELPDVCETINVARIKDRYFFQNGANMNSQFTYMAMMRITYPELFPQYGRILQLDVDTIICDSLKPVWETDLTDKWFAAVPEYLGNYRPFRNEHYFNIGVCLYNLDQMRKDNTTRYMIQLLNYARLMCVEQDALNLFGGHDKGIVLPIRYNECFATGRTTDPAVIHYAGYPDWWTNETTPRREYLEKYLEKTEEEENG